MERLKFLLSHALAWLIFLAGLGLLVISIFTNGGFLMAGLGLSIAGAFWLSRLGYFNLE